MKKIGDLVCKYYKLIIVLCLVLLIPSVIGMIKTRINYDILVYLPDDIETIKGEKILTDDFDMGAYAMVVASNMKDKDIISLEDKIKQIDGVNKTISLDDLTGTTIPVEYLPSEVRDKLVKDDAKLIFVTFKNSTSDDKTLKAVEDLRSLVNKSSKVGGMSAMVLDTKELFNSEMTLYVLIAVLLCIVVLMISLDSYLVPFLLILNIGLAILYNMGTNIFLGDISYITKAISSVLQLGVTTDFSIFLYHKYESAKKECKDSKKAMSLAINETLVSVLGSSLTTIAGFLALCTMNLKLGTDIGLVMAKGVVFGLVCVVTVFPSLILLFDKWIWKSNHRVILPQFKRLKGFVMKYYKLIFIVFLILLIPAYKAQKKTEVYYKLDESIPANYGYSEASKTLREDYGIVSQEIILVSKTLSNSDTNMMIDEIKDIDGIDLVLSGSSLSKYGLDDSILSEDMKSIYETNKYKLVVINSTYDIATDELNDQITKVNDVVKRYDMKAIVAGEGPLMKDLIEITDQDFKNVNYTSIAIIFVLMLLVLKSISLPVLLVGAIEFAIFLNMGVPYFMGVKIPFIASVVIGTIQLGATIDYAILMTTKYLTERKSGKNKKEAVSLALDTSVSSIFVSGMCFFAATIGVALVSKIDLIGSLCSLIARGAIISMLVVMVIVPSILMIFDKIIVKTTLGFGKGRMSMKKKFTVIFIALLIGLFSMPVKALTKEETVYAKLKRSGDISNITVVEHLINDEKLDKIIDKTNLEDIENTNGKEKYKIDNDTITWKAKGKDIYYRGSSKQDLPVGVEVSYKLNDKEMKVSQILGKKGHVEISLKYINKSKKGQLYTPFVVAFSTVLDGYVNSNVSITNGKVISNGRNYILAGLALPGMYDNLEVDSLKNMDTITIEYDTKSFELSSMYSAITPKVVDSIDLDKLNDMDSIYKSIDTLSSSSKKLVDGAKLVNDGANKIKDGVSSSIDGLKNNNQTIDNTTLNNIQNMASSSAVEEIKSREEEIRQQAKEKVLKTEEETHQIKIASDYGIDNNSSLIDALKLEAHKQMQETEQGMQVYQACQAGVTYYCAYVTKAEDQAIESAKEAFYQSALKLALESASESAYNTALKVAEETASSVSKSVASSVADQVKTTIIDKVVISLDTLKQGLDSLAQGTNSLEDGMQQFDSQGITKITNMVNNNIKPTVSKVKEMKALAHEYNTFTLVADDSVASTKFVLVIDGVKPKEKTITVNSKKSNESFIEKIKGLFK